MAVSFIVCRLANIAIVPIHITGISKIEIFEMIRINFRTLLKIQSSEQDQERVKNVDAAYNQYARKLFISNTVL